MRICLVLTGVPRFGLGGGADRMAGLMKGLVGRGHDVHLVSVVGKHANRPVSQAMWDAVEEAGVKLRVLDYRRVSEPVAGGLSYLWRIFVDPERAFAANEMATRPAVTEAVRAIAPDCVMSFSPDPLVFIQDIDFCPVFALMSETMHLNMATSLEYSAPPLRGLAPRARLRRLRQRLKVIARQRLDLRHCARPTRLAFSAPHYVAWAKRHGLDRVALFKSSTHDGGGPDWQKRRAAAGANIKLRILCIGHLHSTNNASGVGVLFEDVIPALKTRMRPGSYEIHIVGDHSNLPEHLKHWTTSPDVIFRGAVHPPDEEFLEADILLVTVPAKTGPRTRILSGFSYGCCVVAHQNNVLGIPELEHGVNCLLGETGPELADAIARAARDADLRARLGAAGRQTFENRYTHGIATQELERLLDETIAGWRPAVTPEPVRAYG